VISSHYAASGARWWYKWEGKQVGDLTKLQGAVCVGDVSKFTGVADILRAIEKAGSEASNKSPRDACRKFLREWMLEAPEQTVPAGILEYAKKQGVRVRACHPSTELKAVTEATKELKWRTMERVREEMTENQQLHAWQVGRQWWLVLPDDMPIGDSDSGGTAGGRRNGESTDGGPSMTESETATESTRRSGALPRIN
jgi:hypothetical protein